ncbi:unnamed protein product [Paramecium octaurelia]|uniref:Uncharacterized protein n=1 Tax=Paramecium octaurelia TaxID=43137 RepID=A0A8S1YLW5_PAROT|nr:unnamed protein product [Paramecium octaurelia]
MYNCKPDCFTNQASFPYSFNKQLQKIKQTLLSNEYCGQPFLGNLKEQTCFTPFSLNLFDIYFNEFFKYYLDNIDYFTIVKYLGSSEALVYNYQQSIFWKILFLVYTKQFCKLLELHLIDDNRKTDIKESQSNSFILHLHNNFQMDNPYQKNQQQVILF